MNQRDPWRYEYIDSLRGYAVLGVITVHTAHNIPKLSGLLREFADSGQYGVQLFFVTSALTLMLSWHARSDGAFRFYVRRLFRIAPMFWLAIVFYLILDGFRPRYWAPNGITWKDILATATFLHGWRPSSINSVVPGGWSIAVEMTFYAMFPILAFKIRSLTSAGVAVIAASLLGHLVNPIAARVMSAFFPNQPEVLIGAFTNFWIVNQLPVFLIGFAAFFVLRQRSLPVSLAWVGALASIAAIILLPFVHVPGPPHIKYALCFCVLAICLGSGASWGIVNPVMSWLGKLSYSAYLWHFGVLRILNDLLPWIGSSGNFIGVYTAFGARLFFVVFLLGVIAITALLSTLTYMSVERPMIAVGGVLLRRWRSSNSSYLGGVA